MQTLHFISCVLLVDGHGRVFYQQVFHGV
jgi:hypothetical protein